MFIALHAADWEIGAGFKSRVLNPQSSNKTGFTLLPAKAAGIAFTNLISEMRHLTNQIVLNGCGVAAGDVDEDGRCDLYFCSSEGPNKLYRNLGNWQFEDITEAAGVGLPGISATAATFADLNGDGHLDLIVNSLGNGTYVLLNDGHAHFREIARLNRGGGGMSMALADIDGDGFLDLYVANYRTNSLMDMPNARAWFKTLDGVKVIEKINGRPLTDPDLTNRFGLNARGIIQEFGEKDAFYRNIGGTNFTEISFTGGAFRDEENKPLVKPPFDWGLSVAFRDINGDRLPDIYVCNDFETPDRIWINQGAGQFRALPGLALRKSSLFAMGVDFADINRDGRDDILVLDMLARDHRSRMTQMMPLLPTSAEISDLKSRPQYMLTTLSLNRGDGTYAEIGQLAGLQASDWAWSPVFLDVDLDGWEDLLVCGGHERAARDLDVAEHMIQFRKSRPNLSDAEIFKERRAFPRAATGTLAFRNRGDLTFAEAGELWGFVYKGVSQGMALADLDNDGDLDVIINNSNDAPCLFRNDTSAPRVAVHLKGTPPNTQGIGARITVFGGAVPMQSQEMICGGRYLSGDEASRVFATGSQTNDLRIEIDWRSGKHSVISHVIANRLYEIEEPRELNGGAGRNPLAPDNRSLPPDHGQLSIPWFEDVSGLINHIHQDEPYDDFERQPLLPNRLSQLGPGLSWSDFDGDGWEDLLIGSGKGGKLALFANDRNGRFNPIDQPPWNLSVRRDQTSILGWRNPGGEFVVLAGSANYEDGLAVGGSVRSYQSSQKTIRDICPPSASSTGPLAMADIDGDGDLDLFVGGRCLPGKYPESATSVLYRNVAGVFETDIENSRLFSKIGLVSGAVFSDLNGDGQPDLILACDWGPVRVYLNQNGRLTEATEKLGLAKFTGWWNAVVTGDFDGDGRLDIVACNWGRNTKYESHRRQPLKIFFGDLDGDGTEDIIEAFYDAPSGKFVPERQFGPLAQAMPFLRAEFASHNAYAAAGIDELLGDRLKSARVLQAAWLESTVFLNRGDHFEARPLPVEAQMAPAFGVSVGDFDGDGHEDIFLAQNFFATQPETPRYDAGRGLLLRGDGSGAFRAVPGQESGLKVYGEQRGCALCDYDHDGRVDLAVTQNGASTKLYRNTIARPGLRVRLKGPVENPAGIGAVMRLVFARSVGPAREVHAGGGYWSQDSACQVLGLPESAAAILIHWPWGKESRYALPIGSREIEITQGGIVAPAK